MASNSFEGTTAWLRGQWSNPSDIFTILLIIGGDIVQVAIAQLCGGPIKYLTPVSFSFGWVSRSIVQSENSPNKSAVTADKQLDIVCNLSTAFDRRRQSPHATPWT